MSKSIRISLVIFFGILIFLLIKWLTCPALCNLKYPKSGCTDNSPGCPYGACSSNCFFICLPIPGLEGGPLCLFSNFFN